MDDALYHVLVVDIRMNEADLANEDGINLLKELDSRGLNEATKVIMLSAYGTKERTRTAFKNYQVADFLFKEEFKKPMFLESVGNVFAENVNPSAGELAKVLVDAAGAPFEIAHFSNSGSEAVEAAIKTALLATGRKRVV